MQWEANNVIKNKVKPLIIGKLEAPIPVVQGGMGVGVSLSGLAGAVAACGGVGVISTAQIGYREPDFDSNPIQANLRAIKKEINLAREAAPHGIIGVNIMAATRQYEDYVRAAAEAGADIIISGAGLPVTLPAAAGDFGTLLAPIVSSLKSVQVITRYWMKKYRRFPDMVVIEGPKAGGHLGFSLEQLEAGDKFPFDSEAVKIIEWVKAQDTERPVPVIVGGGVYGRPEMEHYLELGADGVQVSTRFVTTKECDASEAFKQAYIRAGKEDIVLVKSPVGMPGRAVRNSFIRKAEQGKIPHGRCHLCIQSCNPSETPYCITDALIHAVTGDLDNGLIFCGENAWRSDRMETVQAIMREFGEQMEEEHGR